MPEDTMLQEAIQAVRQGQRTRARDLLTRLLRLDQNNPDYWLWLSAVVETTAEQVYCLETILRLQPEHTAARQGLILLGAQPTGPQPLPDVQSRRSWQAPQMPVPRRSAWANPAARMATFSVTAVLALSMVVWGGIRFSSATAKVVAYIPTSTPGPTPTFTPTPTAIQATKHAPTRTPKYDGPVPLDVRLQISYTPTPLYVSTPHAANEAYRIAQRAYQAGDLKMALENFNQAWQMERESPDIPFFIAEIQYAQADFPAALEAYQQALDIDPDFAPAYLGKAKASLALDSQADILQDLQQTIELDPGYGAAHLEFAAYYLRMGQTQPALEQLDLAQETLPDSALGLVLRAQVEIQLEQYDQAYAHARAGLAADRGYLPAYSVLARAALLNQVYSVARENFKVYLDYEQKDENAWLWYGQSLYMSGQYSKTVAALDTALSIDADLPEAYTYRGLAYLELEEGQKAVNDFLIALRAQPKSFSANLNLVRGLFAANRLVEARNQLNASEKLAQSDEELAQVHYYRALIVEALRPTSTPTKTPAPSKTIKASSTPSSTPTP